MSDDLKARLACIETGDGGSNWHRNPDGTEALARIEALEAQLEAVARAAYRCGWDASGEGWNAEHPGDAEISAAWEDRRDAAIAAIVRDVTGGGDE